MLGLNPPQTDLRGLGTIAAQYSGEWQHFAPPSILGEAQIRSAVLSLRGFSEPLNVAAGLVKFDNQSVRAEQVRANFPKSELAFTGSFSANRNCEQHLLCNAIFNLETETLTDAAVLKLLNASSGLSIPFFNSARPFEAKWLLNVPSGGTIEARRLSIRNFHAQNVSAELELTSGRILVRRWTAEALGGSHSGEVVFDFSSRRPTITATGSLTHTRMEDIYGKLEEPVGLGSLDLDYRLTMKGQTVDELATSASGSGGFSWHNGEIRNLRSEREDSTALNFSLWAGHFIVEKERIALQNTRMISSSGSREVSGQISFNREWNLKFVRANGSGFIASGTINHPVISSEPGKLAEAR